MSIALKLLCRVIRRRLDVGEQLENILTEYPRLTAAQRQTLESELAA